MVERLATECCISGGGPAGLTLGYLLARAGVEVVVLEKHADFLRDFRGDTIHPSTLELMHDLGLLSEFLALPHQRVPAFMAQFGPDRLQLADFSRLPVQAPFIAMMPQWDFLSFLADQAKRFPNFRLIMQAQAEELMIQDGQVVGVQARGAAGEIEVRAALTVAADGRGSRLRDKAGLKLQDLGAPIDVLWFQLSRTAQDSAETQALFMAGQILIMLNRGAYWQCAYVVPKGGFAAKKAEGLALFRAELAKILPLESARSEELRDWEQVKMLSVQVNRLERWWRPGMLCLGDAAHAMSPVGGVGVNLAVQDAVAAANLLAEPLRGGQVSDAALAAVQRRRSWPTKVTQRLQITVQNRVLLRALRSGAEFRAPRGLRLMLRTPVLRDLPARIIGLGVQPERPAPGLLGATVPHPRA